MLADSWEVSDRKKTAEELIYLEQGAFLTWLRSEREGNVTEQLGGARILPPYI